METNNKLREALEKIANYDYAFVEGSYCHDGQICADIARKALAEPPRNCDVGTAEEQGKRFDAFCDSHKLVADDGVDACMLDCPLRTTLDCALSWAQMPYEKGENNGSK